MKVALVEPMSADRSAIRSVLEKRKETVYAFSNGTDAWAFIEKTPDIDVIIIALNVEGLSGLEICWNSRILAEQRKAMYVIAISDEQDSDSLVEALDAGADDYLQKPLQEETLLARLRVAERMIMLQKQLIKLANRDPLTDLFNRRAFFEKTNQRLLHSTETLCAVMFDIDHFKTVNDNYGHDAGDKVIKAVAKIASTEGALLGRLGGEEFALLIEGKSLLSSALAAENLRELIEKTPIIVAGKKIAITSSFGVSIHQDGDTVDSLLKRADIALYSSKRKGRNKVSVERPTTYRSVIPPEKLHIREKSRA